MSTHPTWYDLLGVEPTASTDEVRRAWRDATAELDPTDRRFRSLSDAAAVLLDEDRRAAYDREIGLADGASVREAERQPVTDEPDQQPPTSSDDRSHAGADVESATGRRVVPVWLLVVLGVLAVALVAAAAWAWTRPYEPVVETATPLGVNQVEDAAREAQAAAERAVVPILSYDFQDLEADQREAHRHMTEDYREDDYDPLFEVIAQNAPGTQTVVETTVVQSGLVRYDSGGSGDRAQVLVFVDRPTTNAEQTEPVVYQDQVTVTMVRVDGEWLVDDLLTTPVGE